MEKKKKKKKKNKKEEKEKENAFFSTEATVELVEEISSLSLSRPFLPISLFFSRRNQKLGLGFGFEF